MKKKKIAQLYIPIFYQKSIEDKENYVENKMTLISANKIEELAPHLPCEEALTIHMQIQKLELQKDEKYQPKPLIISIEMGIFDKLKEKFNQIEDHIPLVLGGSSIPICLIIPKK